MTAQYSAPTPSTRVLRPTFGDTEEIRELLEKQRLLGLRLEWAEERRKFLFFPATTKAFFIKGPPENLVAFDRNFQEWHVDKESRMAW